MHDRDLLNVREQLLRAGIAPRHVNRYVAELRDHMADLVSHERAAGLDLQAAKAKARVTLGDDAQLVKAMIDSGAPRSISAKAPWVVFGVLPLVTLVATMILLAVASMAYFAPFGELPNAVMPDRALAVGMLVNLLGSYAISLALAAACIAVAMRQRLGSAWVWAGLAVIAVLSGPLGMHIEILQPTADAPGGIHGSIVQVVRAAGRVDVRATALTALTRTVVLFALSALALRMMRQRVGQSLV